MDPREIAVGQIWMVDWEDADFGRPRERWVMVAWFKDPWTIGVVVAGSPIDHDWDCACRDGWSCDCSCGEAADRPDQWVREVPVGSLFRRLDPERSAGLRLTAWGNLREVLGIAEVRRLEEAAGMVVAGQGAA